MKRLYLLFLAAVFAFGILLIPAEPANAAQPERYGYSLLKNDNQRAAYSAWVEGTSKLSTEIIFTATSLDTIGNDVMTALEMVRKDYPEYFWSTKGNLKISSDPTTKQTKIYDFQYYFNGKAVTADSSDLKRAREQVRQAVTDALKLLPNNPSDYEIALTLHDYLVNKVQYVSEGDHQTVYGSLVNGKAVCAGYARAYQLLMNAAGIPCTYITGKSADPAMLAAGVEELQPHAWNLVWLDGKCYYTDVTWDDQGVEGLFHEYLNLSLEEISITHFPDDTEILPDSCGHDDYRFFIQNSGKGICDIQEHIDGADAADCFVLKSIDGRNAEYYCTIHYHKDDFAQWFSDNYENIGDKLGFESFDCELVEIGHEHHVLYAGVLHESTAEPSVPPTEQTQPSQTQSPTQETPAPTQGSTVSTQAATQSTQVPTQAPTQATEPTVEETVPVSDPTAPAEPTEPATSPAESNPTESKDEGNSNSDTNESTSTIPDQSDPATQSDPTTPTEATASTVPTDSAQQQDSSGTVIIITIAVLLVGAGIGVALYFVRKKR